MGASQEAVTDSLIHVQLLPDKKTEMAKKEKKPAEDTATENQT